MQQTSSKTFLPVLILGTLFFIFGFVTWLNGTLIQYLQIACELSNFQALLVAFAFYISYFVMALPSSWLLNKTGYKNGMSLGLLVMAVGAMLFVPAAYSRSYLVFLIGLFIIGTGLSVLQTASNPYITILGPLESAAKRISIMGICNKVAGVLAPLALGALVLSDADTLVNDLKQVSATDRTILLDELAQRVILPYTIMAGILVGLSYFIRKSGLPEIDTPESDIEETQNAHQSSVWHYPNLVFGVLALFLYVGAEVIAGDTIGTFGRSQNIPLSETKNFTSFTLAAMVIGYIIGIISIPKIISQSRALTISAIIGLMFTLCALFLTGYTAVLFIALLGLANALVWPAIWPLALKGLGQHTKTGSALLIMAIAGGALLPLVYGALADQPAVGPHYAYLVLLPCYAFILFYSLLGHKMKSWK